MPTYKLTEWFSGSDSPDFLTEVSFASFVFSGNTIVVVTVLINIVVMEVGVSDSGTADADVAAAMSLTALYHICPDGGASIMSWLSPFKCYAVGCDFGSFHMSRSIWHIIGALHNNWLTGLKWRTSAHL